MSRELVKQIYAEQERLEQEEKAHVMSLINQCATNMKLEQFFAQKEFLRIKDMHDFIFSNPTLKGNIKELTFERYIEIYKKNHENDLYTKFNHDYNTDTPELTLVEAIDSYLESLETSLQSL